MLPTAHRGSCGTRIQCRTSRRLQSPRRPCPPAHVFHHLRNPCGCMCLRSDQPFHAAPAHDQPPPQTPAQSRSPHPGKTRLMGLLQSRPRPTGNTQCLAETLRPHHSRVARVRTESGATHRPTPRRVSQCHQQADQPSKMAQYRQLQFRWAGLPILRIGRTPLASSAHPEQSRSQASRRCQTLSTVYGQPPTQTLATPTALHRSRQKSPAPVANQTPTPYPRPTSQWHPHSKSWTSGGQ